MSAISFARTMFVGVDELAKNVVFLVAYFLWEKTKKNFCYLFLHFTDPPLLPPLATVKPLPPPQTFLEKNDFTHLEVIRRPDLVFRTRAGDNLFAALPAFRKGYKKGAKCHSGGINKDVDATSFYTKPAWPNG